MSTEENKAIVRRFFEEVYNQDNLALADQIFAADFGSHNQTGSAIPGPERAKRGVAIMRAAFPDIHWTVEELIAEGDRVVVRATFRGTHRGEFMGIAPTGKRVTVTGVELARLADGKIVEEGWHHSDELHLLQQLGVAPIRSHGEG